MSLSTTEKSACSIKIGVGGATLCTEIVEMIVKKDLSVSLKMACTCTTLHKFVKERKVGWLKEELALNASDPLNYHADGENITLDRGIKACNIFKKWGIFKECALVSLQYILKKLEEKFEESGEAWTYHNRHLQQVQDASDDDVEDDASSDRENIRTLDIISIQLKMYLTAMNPVLGQTNLTAEAQPGPAGAQPGPAGAQPGPAETVKDGFLPVAVWLRRRHRHCLDVAIRYANIVQKTIQIQDRFQFRVLTPDHLKLVIGSMGSFKESEPMMVAFTSTMRHPFAVMTLMNDEYDRYILEMVHYILRTEHINNNYLLKHCLQIIFEFMSRYENLSLTFHDLNLCPTLLRILDQRILPPGPRVEKYYRYDICHKTLSILLHVLNGWRHLRKHRPEFYQANRASIVEALDRCTTSFADEDGIQQRASQIRRFI